MALKSCLVGLVLVGHPEVTAANAGLFESSTIFESVVIVAQPTFTLLPNLPRCLGWWYADLPSPVGQPFSAAHFFWARFKSQMLISGIGPFLFPSDKNPSGHHKNLKTAWRKTLKRAGVPYFRIYDLRSTYANRLNAGGVDEWVTQLLRQGDAEVFKKYSQMKLQMKREALEKMNRQANEMPLDSGTATVQ
jgi:hypothetical protein